MSEGPPPFEHGGEDQPHLARDLSLFDITMIGVGAMIGAGIFVLTGLAAGEAGPALVMAFAFNGFITIFTGMVYAELGSAIPEAGGGYLWVRDALGRDQAFIAGWMSWFAHAVAGSLYVLGFGAFATLLLVEYFGVAPFGLSSPVLEKLFAVIAGVTFAYINFRGAKETGVAGNVVTLVKVTVILVFIIAGFGVIAGQPAETVRQFEPFLPKGYGGVFIAMGLTFIAFEGYEIIVQSGEEVVNPRENIPKAIFYSMAIVVTVYILVAIVLLGAVTLTPELIEVARAGTSDGAHGASGGALAADPALWQVLGHLGELGLARAAEQVLPYGTLVILVAGLFSTLSALNATTYSSTRVGFAMGRDHVLPDAFARVHPRTRTPHISVLFSGALIVVMAVALPIEHVAAATDVMFLLLFLQVNYAAIVIRRKYGERLDYGYLMPWFPLVPIVGIVTKLFLAVYLFNYSPTAWYGAIAWIAVGFGIFFLYSHRRVRETEIEAETRLVSEERAPVERQYQVLVPLANPEHEHALIQLGAALARAHDGEVLLTTVVTVPKQTPLEAGLRFVGDERERLAAAMRHVPKDVPGHYMVTIGHDVGRSIVNISYQRDSDLILVGWRGQRRRRADKLLGDTLDRVVEQARCDVAVLKLDGTERPERILVPTAGGPHARRAADVAGAFLAAESRIRVTLVTFTEGPLEHPREGLEEERARLVEKHELADGSERIEVEVRNGTGDVAADIVAFAESTGVDTILIGATREGRVRQALLGVIPETVGERFSGRVLMVKRYRPIGGSIEAWLARWFGRRR